MSQEVCGAGAGGGAVRELARGMSKWLRVLVSLKGTSRLVKVHSERNILYLPRHIYQILFNTDTSNLLRKP